MIKEAVACNIDIVAVFVRCDYEYTDSIDVRESYVLNKNLFANIAQTETSQGIVAIVKRKEYTEKEFFGLCEDGNVLVLDRLQDPGNIGTMIRTAEAAGYKGIVAIKGTGDIFSPKTVRAAAGSIFRMPVLFVDTPAQTLAIMRSFNKRIISTCFETEINYFDVDLKNNIALIIGNEGAGISKELIAEADLKIKIPMNTQVNSLNAAVAAGILMYESRR